MDESDKSFIETWLAQHYTWKLTAAVKLLLGIDPAKDTKKIELSGNEKASRIYAWAIKKIKEGELTALEEEKSNTGETEYVILRDDFIRWAYKNFKKPAQPLYAKWKKYKIKNKKWSYSQIFQERNREWQEQVDELTLDFYKNNPHSKNFHSHRCLDLAKKLYPGQTQKEQEAKAATIRRHTSRRDRGWILGKLGKS